MEIVLNTDIRLNIDKIREGFPVLSRPVHGKPLVYLDNAATTQKPVSVIDAMDRYYREYNSNIHRGVHLLSQKATEAYEKGRETVRSFINARLLEEIIFTRGTTESINLVASSYGRKFLGKGDEIIVSTMEHHSNIVPWQLLCEQTGAVLKVIPINDDGEIIYEEYQKLLGPRTKFVSVVHISNSLGTINPIKRIIDDAHSVGAKVLIDGAQSIHHEIIDVRELGMDFFAFSGHKIYGPTGIGILYGKKELLEEMPPYQGGGDMIRTVSFEKTTYNDLPHKFEAGTPNIAGTVGLAAALEYVSKIGLCNIISHEKVLLDYTHSALREMKNVHIIGNAMKKSGVVSFVVDGVHPHDIGTMLDMDGVAVRTGHHCTEPVMKRFCIPATTRASFALYNKKEEIDVLISALDKVIKMFS